MNIEVLREPLPAHGKTVVKVVGAGGAGSNAVNRMVEAGLDGVQFIAVNTDVQALDRCRAKTKLPIGNKVTRGLGAGGKPEVGESAAEEDREMLEKELNGADMVFITAGMGGGTGTGSAPVIAKLAKAAGALTVAVVSKPWKHEREKKMRRAEEGIAKLREHVDTLIVILNQNLLENDTHRAPMQELLRRADDALRQGVQGIAEVITRPGEINIDFADVKSAMEKRGNAFFGIGSGGGENAGLEAAKAAMNNPLYETSSIDGAAHVLINVIAGPTFSLEELDEIVGFVTERAAPDAEIKDGVVFDEAFNDKVQVTVIATGFNAGAKEAAPAAEEEKRPDSEPLDPVGWDSLFPPQKHAGAKNPPPKPFGGGGDLETPSCVRLGRFALVDDYGGRRKQA